MSADNWTQCPRCARARGVEAENKAVQVEASYGNVTVEEFDQLRSELADLRARPVDETFREDWEIGVFDGEFYVKYKGVCGTCNLRYEFKHEHTLDLDGAA
jgi:hypothetical protein